ncbi:hypothetical protein TRICI_003374 [Trichomonascus ciferrii]|uniref:F-box domain-containing protein n=1 Tax=Trichomonascus ciferrii TaxID=44093 RepID=A0A642V941_9ASCO|nr:hypothetical protein TRICI_003374 [Trichomonascus ciferrii]
MGHINHLPVEILDIVFQQCELADLLRIRRLSRGLKEALDRSKRIKCTLEVNLDLVNEQGYLLRASVGRVWWNVTTQELVDHSINGFDFWLKNLRTLIVVSRTCCSYDFHKRLPIMLELILDILEQDLKGDCQMKSLVILPNMDMKWKQSFRSVISLINDSSLNFSAKVGIERGKNESAFDVVLGSKFKDVRLHCDLSGIRFDIDGRLELLSIAKPYEECFKPIVVDGEQVSQLISQCGRLKQIELSDVKLRINSGGFCLPSFITKMSLYDCQSYDDKGHTIVANGLQDLYAQNVSESLLGQLVAPNLSMVRLWDLDIQSTLFMRHLLGSLKRATIDVNNWNVLDIMATEEFTSCPLTHLTLHAWKGGPRIDRLWRLTQLKHLQSLVVYSNDVSAEPQITTKCLDKLVKSLLINCPDLQELEMYLGVCLPRVSMKDDVLIHNRDNRAQLADMLVKDYQPIIITDENLPSWIM